LEQVFAFIAGGNTSKKWFHFPGRSTVLWSGSRSGKSLDDDDGGELHLVMLEEMLPAVADAM